MGSVHDDTLWYAQQAQQRSKAAAEARKRAFDRWWKLSVHNGTLPKSRESLAREAYYAAWGGATFSPPEPTEGQVEALLNAFYGTAIEGAWPRKAKDQMRAALHAMSLQDGAITAGDRK